MKKIEFLNLGNHPITNNYLKNKNPKNEFLYNLILIWCHYDKLISNYIKILRMNFYII